MTRRGDQYADKQIDRECDRTCISLRLRGCTRMTCESPFDFCSMPVVLLGPAGCSPSVTAVSLEDMVRSWWQEGEGGGKHTALPGRIIWFGRLTIGGVMIYYVPTRRGAGGGSTVLGVEVAHWNRLLTRGRHARVRGRRGGWYAAGGSLSSADRGCLICRDGESASQLQGCAASVSKSRTWPWRLSPTGPSQAANCAAPQGGVNASVLTGFTRSEPRASSSPPCETAYTTSMKQLRNEGVWAS